MTTDQIFVIIIIVAALFGLGIGILWEGRGK